MIALMQKYACFDQAWSHLHLDNKGDQVLAFERNNLLFVFNLNPNQSFTDYGIPVSPGKYSIILNSDSPAYGGQGLVDESLTYYPVKAGKVAANAPLYLKLYLPSRTALVFKKELPKKVH